MSFKARFVPALVDPVITAPAGLVLGVPTLTGGSPAFAIAGAAVVVLPRLLPYAFALYMHRRGKPFTVEDHGVKISSDGTIAQTPVRQGSQALDHRRQGQGQGSPVQHMRGAGPSTR